MNEHLLTPCLTNYLPIGTKGATCQHMPDAWYAKWAKLYNATKRKRATLKDFQRLSAHESTHDCS